MRHSWSDSELTSMSHLNNANAYQFANYDYKMTNMYFNRATAELDMSYYVLCEFHHSIQRENCPLVWPKSDLADVNYLALELMP